VDALLGGRTTLAEPDDLFRQRKKALIERALSGELTYYLGYSRRAAETAGSGESPEPDDAEDGSHIGRSDPARHSPRFRRNLRAAVGANETALVPAVRSARAEALWPGHDRL
jgi:hypothetical protein